jgi:hypothetical protein
MTRDEIVVGVDNGANHLGKNGLSLKSDIKNTEENYRDFDKDWDLTRNRNHLQIGILWTLLSLTISKEF